MKTTTIWHKKKRWLAEVREFTASRYYGEMGRSTVDVICPYCQCQMTVYVWSIAGAGKNCSCGAKLNSAGMAFKLIEPCERGT
jgi:hypothetical protein